MIKVFTGTARLLRQKTGGYRVGRRASRYTPRRRFATGTALAAAIAILSGCGTDGNVGAVGNLFDQVGGIATSEPRVALTGKDIMAVGGNAVDAAVAMGLAMTVTMPSRVGIGGGGMCLVHEPPREDGRVPAEVRVIDFRPKPFARGLALPGHLRGLAALHATYGRLRWAQVVTPAENLARIGHPASRALVQDVTDARGLIVRDPVLRTWFFKADRSPIDVGDVVRMPELAAALAGVRRFNVGELYGGRRGQQYAQIIGADIDDLRNLVPVWRDPVTVPVGDDYLAVATVPENPAAAKLTNALAAITANRGYGQASEEERASMVATLLRSATRAPTTNATAGLVVVDNFERAVGCIFTKGRLFGAGRVAGDTGIVPAFADSSNLFAGPVLQINDPLGRVRTAAVGTSGRVNAPAGADGPATAVVTAVAEAVFGVQTPEIALNRPRALSGGAGEYIPEPVGDQGYGRAELIMCRFGERFTKSCTVASDPRGNGLAVGIGQDEVQ